MNGVNWQQHCVGTKLAMYLLIRRAGSRRVFEHFSMSNKARMARWAIYHKVTVLLFCWFVYIAIYLISIMNIELKGPAAYGTAPYALGLLLTRFCSGDAARAARSFRAALEACGCPPFLSMLRRCPDRQIACVTPKSKRWKEVIEDCAAPWFRRPNGVFSANPNGNPYPLLASRAAPAVVT